MVTRSAKRPAGSQIRRAVMLGTSLLALCAFGVAPALAQPAAARSDPAVTAPKFSQAVQIQLPANAAATQNAGLYAVSCPAAGFCVAGGEYLAGASSALVVTQSHGRWSRGVAVRLPASQRNANGAEVNGVGCTAEQSCVAVGYSYTGRLYSSFIVALVHGRWRQAIGVKLPRGASASADSELYAVTCVTARFCEAVGDYTAAGGHEAAMAVTETNGTWQRAVEIPAATTAGSNPTGISCWQPGDCATVGDYDATTTGDSYLPMAALESRGKWQREKAIGQPAGATAKEAALNSVDCAADGRCTAVGTYTRTIVPGSPATYIYFGFAATESGGRWSAAVPVKAMPHDGSSSSIAGISCPASGSCVAVGGFAPAVADGLYQAQVLTGSGTHWGHPAEVRLPAGALKGSKQDAFLDGVSCTPRGYCAAAGGYAPSSPASDFGLPMVVVTS
jgi:hypothetical protein